MGTHSFKSRLVPNKPEFLLPAEEVPPIRRVFEPLYQQPGYFTYCAAWAWPSCSTSDSESDAENSGFGKPEVRF